MKPCHVGVNAAGEAGIAEEVRKAEELALGGGVLEAGALSRQRSPAVASLRLVCHSQQSGSSARKSPRFAKARARHPPH